jgi:hypothetical protein
METIYAAHLFIVNYIIKKYDNLDTTDKQLSYYLR